MSTSVALDHPWIGGRITKNDSLEGVQDRIKLFNSRRKLSVSNINVFLFYGYIYLFVYSYICISIYRSSSTMKVYRMQW